MTNTFLYVPLTQPKTEFNTAVVEVVYHHHTPTSSKDVFDSSDYPDHLDGTAIIASFVVSDIRLEYHHAAVTRNLDACDVGIHFY